MSQNKKLVFLTGTRADFGKLKSLIAIAESSSFLDVYVFVTGMHLNKTFGYTIDEINKEGYQNIYQFKNHDVSTRMDIILSNTIKGFSQFLIELQPDLIVVHGDRVEALAGAISGSLNNILVAHIEGGEISGTIDESIRHAVSKMSHVHFVANEVAKKRLIQLGELPSTIYKLGSPDLDLMNPNRIPKLNDALNRYEIKFTEYSIAMFHPVTTEINSLKNSIKQFVDALLQSKKNYIVIYPNNDLGSNLIIDEFKRMDNMPNFQVFPSIRFEYFLTFLYYAKFIIGNSSAGIREAPFYDVPTINIGTRQNKRSTNKLILNTDYSSEQITEAINKVTKYKLNRSHIAGHEFGDGKSNIMFLEIMKNKNFWKTLKQKNFQDQ
ncbi:UDP-N-acetylglucosamine 2-epimerase [Gammaproteobacteria bacterium]|nr:UDP-N-acetylglucosamine 2-epimerase [Gammaproteobacteria bacterium]